jgi:beta-N-acetylhexosaminidase
MRRFLLSLCAASLVAGCGTWSADTEREQLDDSLPTVIAMDPPVDPATPSGWGPTRGEINQARAIVAAMSMDERAWQVLMPAFWGFVPDKVTGAEALRNQKSHRFDTVVEALEAHAYGGLFVKPEAIEDAGQVHDLVEVLHENGDGPDGLPLIVAVDQEGGVVQRIKDGVTRVPSARSIGRVGNTRLARRIARNNGEEMRALGFTMVLAPVADADTAGNALVASRSYSSDYDDAAAMVVASFRGYLDAGIIPVVKHFPGHGSVSGDSHRSLPVQRKSVAALMGSDLKPFQAAVEAGVPAIMTGHIAVPELDGVVPASLSPGMVQGVLRERLGFAGLVVTDSQGMGPVHGRYGGAEGAVLSLLAGNDLVLNSPDVTSAHRAVLRAVKAGRLPEVRLADAATRVVAVRLLQTRIGGSRPDLSVLRSSEHLADAARVAAGG